MLSFYSTVQLTIVFFCLNPEVLIFSRKCYLVVLGIEAKNKGTHDFH